MLAVSDRGGQVVRGIRKGVEKVKWEVKGGD